MKVLNLIWGFTLGAGIDKCYLTYARLGELDDSIEMKNVCINIQNIQSHYEPLQAIGVEFINIRRQTDFSWINKLKDCIERERPDVLFTHGFNGAIIMLIERIFKHVRTKTILTYHGDYYAPTKKKKVLEPIYNKLPIIAYKKIAYYTICVAEASAQHLRKKGVPECKLAVVHNGIPSLTNIHGMNLEGMGVKIISASRIDEIKGLNYLIEALSIIKSKGLNFTYYMIGEGPMLEQLKQMASSLNMTDDVISVGFQSNVPEWLASADIFAFPSLKENHSIAVLEAMRAGICIVATNVGGNCESVNDEQEALIVPPADIKALADALEKVIINANLRKRLSVAARERFDKEFTEEAMMRNIIKVLKS